MVATLLRHHNPREERLWEALRPLQRGGPVLRLQCGHGNAHVEALSLGGCSAVDVRVGTDMSLGVGVGLGQCACLVPAKGRRIASLASNKFS